jgi:hypothetical protein
LTATGGQATVTFNIQDQATGKLVNIDQFWVPVTADFTADEPRS